MRLMIKQRTSNFHCQWSVCMYVRAYKNMKAMLSILGPRSDGPVACVVFVVLYCRKPLLVSVLVLVLM